MMVGDTPLALVLPLVGGSMMMMTMMNLKTRPRKLYPNIFEAALLFVKLALSPCYKVWGYRRHIKPGMEIADDLWFKLPFNADRQASRRYSDVCQLKATTTATATADPRLAEEGEGGLPLFYPATTLMYPSVCLLLQRRYLFPVLGVVHSHNYFRFMRPLSHKEKLEALVMVDHQPHLVKPGVEVRFPALLFDKESGKEVWNSTTTCLLKVKHKEETARAATSLPPPFMDAALQAGHKVKLVKQGEWSFPANQGWLYAQVSGDFNPIHVSPWMAKLSGFPRCIAHGMFVCARAFDEALAIGRNDGTLDYPLESEVRFRRPVLLPSTVVFKIYQVTSTSRGGGRGVDYLYLVENPLKKDRDHPERDELCLEGYIHTYIP